MTYLVKMSEEIGITIFILIIIGGFILVRFLAKKWRDY